MSLPSPTQAYKKVFVQGVVSGIGGAVGTTVGFAVLLAVLGGVFSFLGEIPFLGDVIRPVVQIVRDASTPRHEPTTTNYQTQL